MEVQVLHQQGPMAGSIWAGSKGTWIGLDIQKLQSWMWESHFKATLWTAGKCTEVEVAGGWPPAWLDFANFELTWSGSVGLISSRPTAEVAVLRVQMHKKTQEKPVDLAAVCLVQEEHVCLALPKSRTWLCCLFHVCSEHKSQGLDFRVYSFHHCLVCRLHQVGFCQDVKRWIGFWTTEDKQLVLKIIEYFCLSSPRWMDKLLLLGERLLIVGTFTKYINWLDFVYQYDWWSFIINQKSNHRPVFSVALEDLELVYFHQAGW